jgi:hypothetical protein
LENGCYGNCWIARPEYHPSRSGSILVATSQRKTAATVSGTEAAEGQRDVRGSESGFSSRLPWVDELANIPCAVEWRVFALIAWVQTHDFAHVRQQRRPRDVRPYWSARLMAKDQGVPVIHVPNVLPKH